MSSDNPTTTSLTNEEEKTTTPPTTTTNHEKQDLVDQNQETKLPENIVSAREKTKAIRLPKSKLVCLVILVIQVLFVKSTYFKIMIFVLFN